MAITSASLLTFHDMLASWKIKEGSSKAFWERKKWHDEIVPRSKLYGSYTTENEDG